jgi:hypothetical protein
MELADSAWDSKTRGNESSVKRANVFALKTKIGQVAASGEKSVNCTLN